MKAFLFITGHFNDIDHTSSLIKALLERSHKVYLICLTQYNLDTDPRISLLRRFPNFQIHNFKALPRILGKSNDDTGSLTLISKIYRELAFGWITAWFYLALYKIDCCIFTWGKPRAKGFQRHIFRAAMSQNLPTYCLPHGQNIYKNYDVNHYLRKLQHSGNNWPDFSSRNEFSCYVVQTNHHRAMHIAWGMNPDKVYALGSLRFDPKWIQENALLYEKYHSPHHTGTETTIVFFLPLALQCRRKWDNGTY